MPDLVIVESSGKIKSVSKYLGNSYTVVACMGTMFDLPPKELGVDIEKDFKPTYKLINDAGRTKKLLKKIEDLAKKSDRVLIATDPDREGEAIGWHLANSLQKVNSQIHRITFNEITKKGVTDSIKNISQINLNLVDAQQARRIMDRLVGYQVSPFLWKTISKGLSAGRVQSVALRLICERDLSIEEFDPEEYWSISGEFDCSTDKVKETFLTELVKIDEKKIEISNKKDVEKIVKDIKSLKYNVSKIATKKTKKSPQPPFITSSLLQAGVNKLGFTAKRTMMIAQQLYEGIDLGKKGVTGLITYMRTDSTRVADEAIVATRDFITKKYGIDFVEKKKRIYKSKKNIQDAHEAIRPTNINLEPKKIAASLTKEQLKLYNLIWSRFVATQVKNAIYNQTTVEIQSSDKKYLFRLSSSEIHFKGFLQIYSDLESKSVNGDDKSKEKPILIPKNIDVGKEVALTTTDSEQHFTKPPARFNEASLTKTLEELEIGRPSTYATIVTRLITQKYIDKQERKLVSTELGNLVNKILVKSFPEIINVKFTKDMEAELDNIEFGKLELKSVLKEFYSPFEKALTIANENKAEIKKETAQMLGKKCPECDKGELIYRWGRNGKFIACNNFPTCKYSESINTDAQNGDVGNSTNGLEVVGKCEKCGGDLVVKTGRYGKFTACNNYPKCKNIIKDTNKAEPIKTGIKCPNKNCDGDIIERKSKRGKKFYGCSNYPKCDYVSWHKPIDEVCPECKHKILEERVNFKTKETKIICPACNYEAK